MQSRSKLADIARLRGVVVSAEYSYLVGTDTSNATHSQCFARRFLREHELPLMVRCGGFHIGLAFDASDVGLDLLQH